jgi:TetR/AcrR family transcriptional regulator, transcriptional repressor for nem operon
MRHANQTKVGNHLRIVSEASRLMRERGIDHVSVSDVMKASGLTHGGFYAHFASKEALANAAVTEAFRQKIDFLNGPEPDTLTLYVESFLSDGHLFNLSEGCPIVGFAPEALKRGDGFHESVSSGISSLVSTVSERMQQSETTHEDAIRLLATLVGGMLMARAVLDPDMQKQILDAVRSAPNIAKSEQHLIS